MKKALLIQNLEFDNFINGDYYHRILQKIYPFSKTILPNMNESNEKTDLYLINLDFILRYIRELYQVKNQLLIL